MTQAQVDALANAFRSQGLTWSQTNFAVSVVRNSVAVERERCADLCDGIAAVCADSSNGVRKQAGISTATNCAKLIRAA